MFVERDRLEQRNTEERSPLPKRLLPIKEILPSVKHSHFRPVTDHVS